jgi:cell shape-determining protein MreC
MKMNYLLKSSNFEDRKKTARKRILIVIIILVIALLILATGPARQAFFFIASPIWKLENAILNSSPARYFKSKQALMDEKTIMEQKLFLAGNLLALNDTLQTENDSLKDLLGRKDTKQKTVLASVLVKPPQTPYDSLIIDIGDDYGVKVGDKVMANANVYIGEVSEVLSHSAKITLYSTPGKKLSVVLGKNSVTAEAVGMGGGNFNIFLPREIEVKEGDVIIIPSITANVFGIVEKLNFKDKDSFQTVLFKSPVNVSELNFVEIVL